MKGRIELHILDRNGMGRSWRWGFVVLDHDEGCKYQMHFLGITGNFVSLA